jgi:glycosyltransferase involved in cell wall biosynthesis
MADLPNRNASRPRILHISADFPDPINAAKPAVIANLLDLVGDKYDNQVLSLNRRSPTVGECARLAFGGISPADEASLQSIGSGDCIAYRAPPKGIFHAAMLTRLARWIAARILCQPERPQLVVGHKLTVEGIIASAVARQLGVPYAITIQGNTDTRILDARPDLRGRFASIYHEAACVFSFAPWAREVVAQRLGARTGPTIDLPCPTVLDTIQEPVSGGSAMLSVFHLRNHKIKNLRGLASAMRQLDAAGCTVPMHLIGGGNQADTAACQAIIAGTANIALIGPKSQAELGAVMNQAIALVMPSLRESFGLVFVEALFAGLPVIYPKNAAVSGYFDGLPFAIAVDPKQPRAIAEAMKHVIARESDIKQALSQWQRGGGLERFTRTAIRSTFDHGLQAALLIQPGEPPL